MRQNKQIQSSRDVAQLSETQLYQAYARAHDCLAKNICPHTNSVRISLIMNTLIRRKKTTHQKGEE